MRRKGVGLPLALGVITCALLALVLWPKEAPQKTVVVAARRPGRGPGAGRVRPDDGGAAGGPGAGRCAE